MKKILLTLALATAFSAQAVEYTQVQPDKSAIHFTYKQMGVAVDGQFRKFTSYMQRETTGTLQLGAHSRI